MQRRIGGIISRREGQRQVWVKGEGVKGGAFGWTNSSAATLALKPLPEGTYDWQRVEISATPARMANASLQLLVSLTAGTLWIDDLESLAYGLLELFLGIADLEVKKGRCGRTQEGDDAEGQC